MAEPIVVLDSSDEEEHEQHFTSAAPAPSGSSDRAPEPATPAAAAAPQPTDGAAATAAGDGGSGSTDDKEQMECPICLQTCIHPARLPCGHIFCFLCVKGVAHKNRRCAMCRREIPVEFLDHPHLLYKIEETPPTSEDGYQWFYEGRNGWWQYDERTSQEIEDAFKRPDKFCTILVAGYVYVVDFETMLQQRQNEPSRKRLVKRDLATIAKKGVAGLRIDGTADPLESMSASLAATAGTTSAYSQQQQQHQHHQHRGPGGQAASSSSARSPLPALVANNLISTIAATDAAIRIASDIIDSTLAHASTDSHASASLSAAYDYHGDHRRRSAGDTAAGDHSADGRGSASSRQDLLNEVQEALNMSGGSSSHHASAAASALSVGGSALGAAVAAAHASTSPRLDFFSQTIDEFRSLALSNIAESSTDSDSDDEDGDDESGVDIGVQHLSGGGHHGGHHGDSSGGGDLLLVSSAAAERLSSTAGGQSASTPASNELF